MDWTGEERAYFMEYSFRGLLSGRSKQIATKSTHIPSAFFFWNAQ